MIVYLLIFLAVQLFQGIFLWKGYIKAGYKGWQAFVPIWNMLILFKIIQRPWWWIFLVYLPVIGNVMAIVIIYDSIFINFLSRSAFSRYFFMERLYKSRL